MYVCAAEEDPEFVVREAVRKRNASNSWFEGN